MIKFLATRMDRPMLGLGLSKTNCEKLLAGKPIFIDLKVMMAACDPATDMNDATIFIFGGDTEEQMIAELKKHFPLPSEVHEHHEEN